MTVRKPGCLPTARWSHPRAFHAHQGGDKGFGPAAGPGACAALEEAFVARGYAVRSASSRWRLGDESRELIGELAAGIAAAAAETGRVSDAQAKEWADARRGATAIVGHRDILAWPAG